MRNVPFLKSKFQVEVQDEADESVLAEIFSLREYAPIEPSLKTARRGILDVGGHKGYFVLYLRALNPTVPIWTYEPEQKNFALLKEHVRLNHLEGVQVKNVAVAAEEGTLLLNVSEDSHNHSLVVQPGTTRQQKVNATTLEKILNKMQECDLIKMDCEGAEFQILENAESTVFEVPEFFLEYHEYGPTMKAANLKVLFERQGFSVKLTPSKFDKRMGFLWARKK